METSFLLKPIEHWIYKDRQANIAEPVLKACDHLYVNKYHRHNSVNIYSMAENFQAVVSVVIAVVADITIMSNEPK